jgi:hypothetical protein
MTTQNSTKRYGVSQWGVAHEEATGMVSRCGVALKYVEPSTESLAGYAVSLRGKPPIEVCPQCAEFAR